MFKMLLERMRKKERKIERESGEKKERMRDYIGERERCYITLDTRSVTIS